MRIEDIIFLDEEISKGALSKPIKIDSDIEAFCVCLKNNNKPLFVKIKPFSWSRFNCCDLNVKKIVSKYGGKIIYGYKLYSIPNFYIEGIPHCIWEDLDGNLLDITPSDDLEKEILFLPDEKLFSVRLESDGKKPRLALRESVKDYVQLLIEIKLKEIYLYPSDDDLWNRNHSYRRG